MDLTVLETFAENCANFQICLQIGYLLRGIIIFRRGLIFGLFHAMESEGNQILANIKLYLNI